MSLRGEQLAQERARLLVWLGVGAVVLVLVTVGLLWAGHQTALPPTAAPPAAEPGASEPERRAGPAVPAAGEWDVAAETALASTPMLSFSDAAAMPQTLSTLRGRAPMVIPTGTRLGPLVAEGFPPIPQGAVGQLAALLEVGLTDVAPASFAAAYRSVSLPGAPDPALTPLGGDVADLYGQAVTTASDATPVSSRWQLAGALIKGITDGGRFAVVCVSGELQAVKVNSVSAGTADCQAMRWTGRDWRIAPGVAAARAPVVWPGSDAFVQAGYSPATQGGG